ncbi:type II toxin-antitoxin system prevent-host-death family antitoxin [Streptomyces sp. NPDC006385]|uniref:type II toxin-antitoxin system prevent-host-death family antitoxin n=1 Tax=Streptomyces sp. NPDC006385 TaxID=3156761 RepID=UPI0033B4A087
MAHLFPLIEQVNEDHAPVHITSRKGNAVLMSEEDFNSWTETVHLLRSPKNARRLLDSIAEAEAGEARHRELRRINKLIDDTHRLVYKPTDDELIIVQARYHY